MPSIGEVPAIFRSRLVDISEKKEFKIDEERQNFWRKYFQSGPMERLALSKDAAGDKKTAHKFLNELEVILEKRLKSAVSDGDKEKAVKKITSLIEETRLMRQYLGDRASYPKMIIEHFALTSPKF